MQALRARPPLWYAIPVRSLALASLALAAALASGCGGGSSDAARKTVFDPGAANTNNAVLVENTPGNGEPPSGLERPYHPLDREAVAGQAHWIGVSILHDGVRFSRPSRWLIHDAALDPGRTYLQYISPTGAYSFAFYERTDSAGDAWKDVMQRYENDVVAAGAKMTGQRVPMATDTNQGRAYTVVRKIDAGKLALASKSREILLRGPHHIVLVQVVAQDDGIDRLGSELLEVLRHIEVL
jgi:hypothetical protein